VAVRRTVGGSTSSHANSPTRPPSPPLRALADQLARVVGGVYGSVQALTAAGPATQARATAEALNRRVAYCLTAEGPVLSWMPPRGRGQPRRPWRSRRRTRYSGRRRRQGRHQPRRVRRDRRGAVAHRAHPRLAARPRRTPLHPVRPGLALPRGRTAHLTTRDPHQPGRAGHPHARRQVLSMTLRGLFVGIGRGSWVAPRSVALEARLGPAPAATTTLIGVQAFVPGGRLIGRR
jgi:hypothetical protein